MSGLAAIFAHPDDESFVVGGTVPRYVAAGIRCDLYCATNGDAGRASGVQVGSREALGTVRKAELLAAARELGFGDVRAPGHPDGDLGRLDADMLIGEIVDFLRQHRPRVVITFGPEGAPNAHRDHRAISRAATAAFFLAGSATSYPEQLGERQPHAAARLYYQTWPRRPRDEVARPDGLPATARVEISTFHEVKRAAFLKHVTQQDHRAAFEQLAMTEAEWFALAAGVPQPEPLIEDLFAGI
jgi:LmbE family N-acetylglucosaminyl deacetylase